MLGLVLLRYEVNVVPGVLDEGLRRNVLLE